MHLEMSNIGSLDSVSINLNGFTVLTGVNNSGKSTVLKTIYTLIQPCLNVDQKVMDDIRKRAFLIDSLNYSFKSMLKNEVDYDTLDKEQLLDIIDKYSNKDIKLFNEKTLKMMKEYLKGEIDNQAFLREYVKAGINGEFYNQIEKQGKKSFDAKLLNNEELLIEIVGAGDSPVKVDSRLKNEITNIVYIDTPLIFDRYFSGGPSSFYKSIDHRVDLREKIDHESVKDVFDSLETSEAVDKLNKIISKAIEGNFKRGKKSIEYNADLVENLNPANLAAGIKMIGIIKILLDNGHLRRGSILLMDEPEIHLHPQWQLILAELLVSIKQELGVTIVLSTHSSQFLMSIEGYSKKMEVDVDYYYSNIQAHSFDNVNGRLQEIYGSMSGPLIKADSMRHIDV